MTTSTLPRLPRELMTGGSSVAVRLPLEANSVAHKVYRDNVPVTRGFITRQEPVIFAACTRDTEEPCGEFTAAWADHKGAQACTEKACFPEAGGR